ncbi:MAG: YebC/PmpR family DNA-binding transcriptional regulator [bacterium]
MSGHSKWHNIKEKKSKVDAQKGKLFTTVSKEIMMAVKEAGPEPDTNYRLKMAIQKAKDVNMPQDNIKRSIDRASGVGSENIEEINYEGYGPHGVAIIVEAATDNRNRMAAEMRNLFSKSGGSLGEAGCVAWMFDKRGVIEISSENIKDEDELMMTALEAGAEDLKKEEDVFQILTSPSKLHQVRLFLEEKKFPIESAEITMIPKNTVTLDKNQAAQVLRLMDALEDQNDTLQVYANFDIPAEILEEMAG